MKLNLTVGQTPILANSELLMTFLFSAQQETHSVRMHEVDIEISLMNGYRIPLSVSSTDSSSTILDIACNKINLPKELVKYFALYLFNWSCAKSGQPSLKKLEDYESPYISQKYVRPEDKIVLRKRYISMIYLPVIVFRSKQNHFNFLKLKLKIFFIVGKCRGD